MTFLYLNSDQMGHGDEELGRMLLTSFLDKLSSADIHIDAVGCVNSAINLTTQKGPVLEVLNALEEKGATIVSCCTCLDHLGRRDNLLIGEIGTMDQTVQLMVTADKIIRV